MKKNFLKVLPLFLLSLAAVGLLMASASTEQETEEQDAAVSSVEGESPEGVLDQDDIAFILRTLEGIYPAGVTLSSDFEIPSSY